MEAGQGCHCHVQHRPIKRDKGSAGRTHSLGKSIAVTMIVTPLSMWASAALAAQDAGPPRCTTFNVADSTPLAGVKLVSAGRIAPGEAVRPELQPGKPCVLGPGNRCASEVKAGTAGVLLHRFKSWVCVALPAKGKINTQAGWIPENRWARDQTAATGAWAGIWQNEGAKITVTSSQGRLHFVGGAIWQGLADPHFGSFEFDAVPDGDMVTLTDGCEVRIRRVGEYLFAQDNQQCGGMNVSFDGLFRFRGDLKP
ncbi:hypothetical protein [Roseateles sp.]|uniref:hypothetical protein n=1 Tax=Roseateles sp. TaxID=1971397 RepID=UPI0025F59C95|nr:hypothetical protein [Roseateles sp.]MBV8034781.1 hypothetical protein [Roseateles sp.]